MINADIPTNGCPTEFVGGHGKGLKEPGLAPVKPGKDDDATLPEALNDYAGTHRK